MPEERERPASGPLRSIPAQIGAVALLTLREVYRKKFFLVLVFFVLGVISVFGLAPGLDPDTASIACTRTG